MVDERDYSHMLERGCSGGFDILPIHLSFPVTKIRLFAYKDFDGFYVGTLPDLNGKSFVLRPADRDREKSEGIMDEYVRERIAKESYCDVGHYKDRTGKEERLVKIVRE
ncbi:MAG: hypothetical protein KJ592_04765 [Nanoarchaeota archaeon]|nr:hypothetical protein [Nanoarchaeota archaeon]